jgi:hypothetical protein
MIGPELDQVGGRALAALPARGIDEHWLRVPRQRFGRQWQKLAGRARVIPQRA